MLKNSCMEDTKFLVPSVRVTIATINKKKKIKDSVIFNCQTLCKTLYTYLIFL